jgi:tRNA G10  N-methylase Trm11
MRQHDGRAAERPGALRPTVAAAMVRLAGEPPGILLDPCCGSGTILAEAAQVGWQARGVDIDPEAIRATHQNAPKAQVNLGDARRLELGDQSMDACVSNLPFGLQYEVQGGMEGWLRAVLGELNRVTRPGGRVVLLAPSLPASVVPPTWRRTTRLPIRLLGTKTVLWAIDRAASPPRAGRHRTDARRAIADVRAFFRRFR